MKTKSLTIVFTICLALIMALPAFAAQDVGKVVQLKGMALVHRDSRDIPAKVHLPLQATDVVQTQEQSRTKMFFIDESILTLGPSSKASIKEFISSKEGGASVFNLVEGSMRAVVGKNKFEVHTPTTVAAARGTVINFEVGKINGVSFTTISVLEGIVCLQGIDPAAPTAPCAVELMAGYTITVTQGSPMPAPVPFEPGIAPTAATSIVLLTGDDPINTGVAVLLPPFNQGAGGSTGGGDSGGGDGGGGGGGGGTEPPPPPVNTPVDIVIEFPGL